jgi:predicted ATPase/class 3 adenylate cyclase/DNA-binding CsgD family transcriptional regulator
MHSGVPTGTVTFLFTDIEGSTRLAHEQRASWEDLRRRHSHILTAAMEAEGGFVFEVIGDAFSAAFHAPVDAVRAAVRAQQDLDSESWHNARIRVRMGVHTGGAEAVEGHYRGYLTLSTVQRITAAAYGGQVILSEAAFRLVQDNLPDGVSARDLGPHRLKDLQRPQQLFQLVIPGLSSDFPPPMTLDLHPHNLPVLVSSFVGRRDQIVEIGQLLQTRRLVTLTGPGGCGKTRLALELARQALPTMDGGVWQVDLGSLTDPALVAQTAASALGVREEGGRPIVDTLSDYLHLKRLLLVLDNCEHLVEACAEFAAAMLKASPSLTILATSREPMGVDGEAVWNVPPLSLPAQSVPSPAAAAKEGVRSQAPSESVQLFVARAGNTAPAFSLTAQNTQAVEEICRRLDGIPLAIELAAARLRALSVQEIAAHLDDRFQLLSGGSRTAPPRHKTLEATLDWSYALLSEVERKALQRLSVFAGGCTLEAAECVCSVEDISREEVLDLLSRLVDKSLLVAETGQGSSRYRLLETIRQWARQKLLETGEADSAYDRHLQFFLGWAEHAERLVRGPEQVVWLQRFGLEHDNIRAALDWSQLDDHRVQSGLRLAGAAGVYWQLHNHQIEGRRRLHTILAHPAAQTGNAPRAKALYRLGVLAFYQSDYPTVRSLLNESLAIWRAQQEPDRRGIALALEMLAETQSETGDLVGATPIYEEALRLFKEVGYLVGIGDTIKMLGWSAMRLGDYERADQLLSDGLQACRQSGDPLHITYALAGLGELAVRRGQFKRADELLRESLETSRSIGDKWGTAAALGSLGWLALERRDFDQMREFTAESLSIRAESGDRGGMAWCLEKLARAAWEQHQFVRAAALFGAASGVRSPIGSRIDAADQPAYDHALASVKQGLGGEAFAEAWDEGARMPLNVILQYALEDSARSPGSTERSEKERFSGLTKREREVAAWIAQGKSNREIAEAMTVGARTVETYVTRILAKLGLDSRVQVATWAIEKQLRPPRRDD